ncbi:hypothetical protein SRHO_G00097660 [Serrasalmus rhombeus]
MGHFLQAGRAAYMLALSADVAVLVARMPLLRKYRQFVLCICSLSSPHAGFCCCREKTASISACGGPCARDEALVKL